MELDAAYKLGLGDAFGLLLLGTWITLATSVLSGLGYDRETIATLRSGGVV